MSSHQRIWRSDLTSWRRWRRWRPRKGNRLLFLPIRELEQATAMEVQCHQPKLGVWLMHMYHLSLLLLHLSGLHHTGNTQLLFHLTLPHPTCMAAEVPRQILMLLIHLSRHRLLQGLTRQLPWTILLHMVAMEMFWLPLISRLTTDRNDNPWRW